MNSLVKPEISICVLSYQGKEELHRCLASLKSQIVDFAIEILVTDNGSTDGTAAMVAGEFPEVTLIENKQNLPFTVAFNVMTSRARGRLIAIVSNDIEFPERNTLHKLRTSLEVEESRGIVAPKQIKPDGSLDAIRKHQVNLGELLSNWTLIGTAMTYLFPRVFKRQANISLSNSGYAEVVQDSCIILRADLVKDGKLYDERFRMYYTEDDICIRASREGYKIYYDASVAVLHKHRHGTRKSNRTWVEWIYVRDAMFYGRIYVAPIRTVLFLEPLAYFTFMLRIIYRTATGKLGW